MGQDSDFPSPYRVTPHRGDATRSPRCRVVVLVRPHEETLIRWWALEGKAPALVRDPFSFWSQVADWCHGAALAMMDVRGREQVVVDFEAARALAESRAYLAKQRELPLCLRDDALGGGGL